MQRVAPFILRRTKNEVANELPAKTETLVYIPLLDEQKTLYETIRLSACQEIRESIQKTGTERNRMMILDTLLKLRQVCCHPRLTRLEHAEHLESAKLNHLLQMVTELVEEGRKILIFSQFTSMLSLIEHALRKRRFKLSKLTGETKDRVGVVESFQQGHSDIFLISLKAGGTGLNLTAADTVIHYDPWWNPAVEQQATDRAYRIGQDKPVFVYKLLTEHSVEDSILSLQQQKQALMNSIYSEAEVTSTQFSLSTEELLSLIDS